MQVGCAHAGEEFLLVLSGRLARTELYSPAHLEKGDSCYFDGSMAHAYLNGGTTDLWKYWWWCKLLPQAASRAMQGMYNEIT